MENIDRLEVRVNNDIPGCLGDLWLKCAKYFVISFICSMYEWANLFPIASATSERSN